MRLSSLLATFLSLRVHLDAYPCLNLRYLEKHSCGNFEYVQLLRRRLVSTLIVWCAPIKSALPLAQVCASTSTVNLSSCDPNHGPSLGKSYMLLVSLE
jgi:hypothetical protein